jgi:hypothetical protein
MTPSFSASSGTQSPSNACKTPAEITGKAVICCGRSAFAEAEGSPEPVAAETALSMKSPRIGRGVILRRGRGPFHGPILGSLAMQIPSGDLAAPRFTGDEGDLEQDVVAATAGIISKTT